MQVDCTQKSVFVLGVYASAVHARWVGADGKILVKALAVSSEPYIFWRGDGAEALLQGSRLPEELGRLVPAAPQYNGPSGVALDDLILKPLGLSRADTWLCDLVPHSCVNPAQRKAIARAYAPLAKAYGLPTPTVPPVPKALTDETRRSAIWDEVQASGASTLILLGDKPIQWFLAYSDPRWKRLSDFLRDGQPYGRSCSAQIYGTSIDVLPLAHPRQIASLGRSSRVWYDRHRVWVDRYAGQVFGSEHEV
jgi:hypothetical protein